ncbi:MAG: PD-(D/E)XK nuclease family protein, partial [Acidobacteriota bacterium]
DLQALVAAAPPDVLSLRMLDDDALGRWTGDPEHSAELVAPTHSLPDAIHSWRIASFSSLARGGSGSADHGDPSSPTPEPARDPRGLFAFARGPRAGDCLHKIFESIDFTDDPRGPASTQAVHLAHEKFGLDRPERHPRGGARGGEFDPAEATLQMLERVLGTSLPGGLRLSSVGRADRLVEWQFYAPLSPVAPRDLAEVFRKSSRASWAERYADSLETLDKQQLEGFLTGYVDVVVRSGDTWSILDWKSNHLGDRFSDYGSAAMTRSMLEHHYILQAHLYALAVDRFLGLHQPSWCFERDFGGAYYLFLRGVDGRGAATEGQMGLYAGAGTGIFHLKPEPALIAALGERLLEKARPS